MSSSTNTAVVVVPSPRQPSTTALQTQSSFATAPVTSWNQGNSTTTTTSSSSTTSDRIKSFFDFRPQRTGSNEAVVGDNNSSTTKNPAKAPHYHSNFTNTPISAVEATKPRSLSAGRVRASGSVDLVQDIYDRLGITRGDLATTGSTSAKTSNIQPVDIRKSFLNYKNGVMKETPAATDTKTSVTRGRSTMQNSADMNDDTQPRSRSLSRGRQFRSIWPPSETMPTTTVATKTVMPNPQSPKYRRTDVALEPILSPNQQRSNTIVCSPDEAVAAMLSPSRLNVQRAVTTQNDSDVLPIPKSSPSRSLTNYKALVTSNEDKTASTEVSTSNDGESALSGMSVKERMRAFSEPTKKPTTDTKKNKSATAPVRNYPPLIDIFAEERKRQQIDNIGNMEVDEEKKDDDMEYNSAVTTPSASRGKGTFLANAFLAAIQTSPSADNTGISPRNGPTFSFAPINEIATDDISGALDTGSVSILSSVGSHDDMNHMTNVPISRGNTHHNGSATHIRKPSWIDNRSKQQRASVTSTKPTATSTASSGQFQYLPSTAAISSNNELPKQSASTSVIIERMVEERVQARVAELERRMEQQMRTYMEEMEAKMAAIIASYEKEK